MAEFSDYIESRTPVADEDVTGNEILGVSKGGSARSMTAQQVANLAAGASAAEDVSFTPAGNIDATNVQAAIEELDSKKAFRGSYDLSTEEYPSSGGTGDSGVPSLGDYWYGINSGDFDVEDLGTITLYRGALLIYIGGTVSSPSSWIVKQ